MNEYRLEHIMSYTAKLSEPEVISSVPEEFASISMSREVRSAVRSCQGNFARSARIG